MEGAAILTAVLAVAVVTASNDYSKEQQFRALNKVKEDIAVKVRACILLRDVSQPAGRSVGTGAPRCLRWRGTIGRPAGLYVCA